MDRHCFECKFYSMGFGECRRYPPVHVTYQETRYNAYNELETVPQIYVEYVKLDPSNESCGEFIEHPKIAEDKKLKAYLEQNS